MPTDDRPPEQEPPPETPEEPPEDEGFRLLDVRFWLALAFLVLSLIAAAVVGWFGSKIWPPKAPPPPAASSAHAPSR